MLSVCPWGRGRGTYPKVPTPPPMYLPLVQVRMGERGYPKVPTPLTLGKGTYPCPDLDVGGVPQGTYPHPGQDGGGVPQGTYPLPAQGTYHPLPPPP